MPAECSAESFDFGAVEGRHVEAAFDGGLVTSDAGRNQTVAASLSLTPLRQITMAERWANSSAHARIGMRSAGRTRGQTRRARAGGYLNEVRSPLLITQQCGNTLGNSAKRFHSTAYIHLDWRG
jgi:hypothetical protein